MNEKRGLCHIAWISVVVLVLGIGLGACGSSLTRSDNPLIKAEPSEIATSLPPTATPLPQPSATMTEVPTPVEMIRITIVYDNYPYKAGLETAWGFSAYITFQDQNILFDSGGSGALLVSNLAALKIPPPEIQNVVLSHEHNDHTGGLQSLLNAGTDPKLFIPPSFSNGFKSRFRSQAQLIEVRPGTEILANMISTGEMPGPPPEQGLVIDTAEGLVIITGCAHPGVDAMVRQAKSLSEKEIYLVLGGFHLGNATDARVNQIISEFQRLGVKHVAPCHCTGDRAIGMIRNAFGEDFIRVGVGAVITIAY